MAGKQSPREDQREGTSAASSDRPSGATPTLPSARPRSDLAVFAFLLSSLLPVVYNSNFRTIAAADSFQLGSFPFAFSWTTASTWIGGFNLSLRSLWDHKGPTSPSSPTAT